MDSETMMDVASLALEWGFIPILLKGKRPLLPKWDQQKRETALTKFEKKKDCNVGILTGAPSGVVVVDVDVQKGGMDKWQEILDKYNNGEMLKTFTVKTGGGGLHVYFKYDKYSQDLINGAFLIDGKGIDFKTNGGQVVFIESIHESGKKYEVYDWDLADPELVIMSMPAYLHDMIKETQDAIKR